MATQMGSGQIPEKNKKLKKVRSIKLSRKPSLRDRGRTRFRPPPIDSYDDDEDDEFVQIGGSSEEDFQGTIDAEGVSDRPSTSGSCSNTPSSKSRIKGGNGVKKNLKNSKSKKFGTTKSRFHPPDVIDLSDSSPNSMATSCSNCIESKFQGSPKYSEPSVGNDDHGRSPDLDSSIKKSTRSLARSSTWKTRRILMGKSGIKSKKPSVKNRCSESQNTCADRATYSSTIRYSKFPHQVEHGCGEDIQSKHKVCTYNYCSLHGHYHAPETPPRSMPRRRNLLKSQKSIKLKSSQGAKWSVVGEKETRTIKLGAKFVGRDVNEKEDYAILDGFLFGETTYAEKSLQERAFKNQVQGTKLVPNDKIGANIDTNSSSGSCEAHHEGIDKTLENDDLTYRQGPFKNEKISPNDINVEAIIDDGVTYSASVTSPEEEGNGGSAAKGESMEVSSATQIRKEKHISMWRMIHQNLVSGLAEEAGSRQAHEGEAGKDQVVEANAAISAETASSAMSMDQKMDSENCEAESKDIELRKLHAVKLVKDAIEKILLPAVQDQSLDDQSISSDGISEQQEPMKTNHCENEEINNITTDREETVLAVDKFLHDKEESKASKLGNEGVKKTPKSWSYLKKWILLQRFIKEMEKVKKLNFRSPRHLNLEPESEKEKVRLRPLTLGGRKSAETWMLDYALQQVVSELAPTQKRKVALLVEAFESIAPTSGEKHTTTTSSKLEETDQPNQDPESNKSGSECSNTCRNMENEAPVVPPASVSDQPKKPSTAGEVNGGDIETGVEFVEGFTIVGDSQASDDIQSKTEIVDGFTAVEDCRVSTDTKSETISVEGLTPVGDSQASDDIKSETEIVDGFRPVEDSSASTDIMSETEFVEGLAPVKDSRAVDDIKSETEILDGFTPVGDSEGDASAFETNKAMSSEVKQISMWHLIHTQMASGLEAEAEAETGLPEGSDKKKQFGTINNWLPQQISGSDRSFHDSGLTKSFENHDSGAKEFELRKLSAIKLVREAIEKILLPEVEDQSSDDQSITSDVSPHQELSEKSDDGECDIQSISTFTDDGKEKVKHDRQSNPGKLGVEDEGNVSTMVAKSVKKTPKSWSRLKKLLLLKRFVGELEKVRKLDAFKPRHQALGAEAQAEAEKVSLKPQKTGEGKNSEEWMLDHALRQAIKELAPTQKRKVALLVKAFETVVPPLKEEQSQAEEIVASRLENMDFNCTICDEQSNASDPSMSIVDDHQSYKDQRDDIVQPEQQLENGPLIALTNGCDPLDQLWMAGAKKIENSEKGSEVKAINKTPLEKQSYIGMWHQIYQHVATDIAEKIGPSLLLEEDDEDRQMNDCSNRIDFSQSDAVKLVRESVDEILLPVTSDISENNHNEEEDRAVPMVGRLKSKNWSKLKRLMLLQRSIKALERMRSGFQTGKTHHLPSEPPSEAEAEKTDLKHQMMEARKKAEQWMLDYAVQHIVTTLTPARKRRVSMLVEAFEAVVPLPYMMMNSADA